MREYCSQFETEKAVSYCHYCHAGLAAGGLDAMHLARLIFEPNPWLREAPGGRAQPGPEPA